jgi:hypothetical protein
MAPRYARSALSLWRHGHKCDALQTRLAFAVIFGETPFGERAMTQGRGALCGDRDSSGSATPRGCLSDRMLAAAGNGSLL